MAERVATPELQRDFRESGAARAKAANSYLTYRDQRGRLVREWPATGRVEILVEWVVTVPTVYVLAGPNGAGKTSICWYEASDVPRLNGDARTNRALTRILLKRRCGSRKNGWRND